MTRRLLVAFAVLVGLAAPAVTAVASSPTLAATEATATAPITTAFVQGDTTWLVVPMGHLNDFLNTFWQLFVRTPTEGGWVTVTPPGVADNGGLVVTPQAGDGLVAGFLANQDLTFSPLSLTTDGGRDWTGVYFPQALVSVPDALAETSAGTTFGLGRSARGDVLESGTTGSSWRLAMTASQLARSGPGAACGVERLTAIAVGPGGDPLIGAACRRRGAVGLFELVGGTPRAAAVPGGSALARDTVSVLRLVPTAGGIAILLEVREPNGRTALVADWPSAVGQPSMASAPLALPPGAKLLASGSTPSGGVFVLVQPAGDTAPVLANVTASAAGAPAWDVLPHPPRGTLGAAFSPGRIDTVTVHSSTLIDYAWDESSAAWVQSQVIHVPIQYGSSS